MKKISTYKDFINESIIGKYSTISEDDIRLVKESKLEDVSKDGAHKTALLNALESALEYFDMTPTKSVDAKAKLVSKMSSEDGLQETLDLAKTYVASLGKILKIENDEISPISEQIKKFITE